MDQSVNTPPFYGIPPDNPFVGPGDPAGRDLRVRAAQPVALHVRPPDGRHVHRRRRAGRARGGRLPAAGRRGRAQLRLGRHGGQRSATSRNCPPAARPANRVAADPRRYNHSPGDCAIVGRLPLSRHRQVPGLRRQVPHSDNCTGRIRVATEDPPGDLERQHRTSTPPSTSRASARTRAASCTCPARQAPSTGSCRPCPTALDRGPTRRPKETRAPRAVFTVTLVRRPWPSTVTVQYATAARHRDGRRRLHGGHRRRHLPARPDVAHGVDPAPERRARRGRRDLHVNLSAPVGAPSPTGRRMGTITDDDPLPASSRSTARRSRADGDRRPARSRVTPRAGQRPGGGGRLRHRRTARPPPARDYTTASGTLTVRAPATTSGRWRSACWATPPPRRDETFALNLRLAEQRDPGRRHGRRR